MPNGMVGVSGELTLPEAELLDATSDPGAFVVAAVGKAKTWLEQAQIVDLPEVVETKARAEAIRCYMSQKDLGKEAELAASEIVRRAERRIGELIREGQATGEIRKTGEHRRRGADDASVQDRSSSPNDFATTSELSGKGAGIYAMTDGVSSEEFEEAVGEAKAEGNLSRRNVVRKVRDAKDRQGGGDRQPRAVRAEQIRGLASKGHSSRQIAVAIGVRPEHVRKLAAEEGIALPADEAIGRVRRIDGNRVVSEVVSTLEGLGEVLDLVDIGDLDQDRVGEWVGSLRSSLRLLQRFTKELSS